MFNLEDIERLAKDKRELGRAEELTRRNKIQGFECDAYEARADVFGTGSKPYVVRVALDLTAQCQCKPFSIGRRGFCKHVAAVAMEWLKVQSGNVITTGDVDPELVSAIQALDEATARELLMDAAFRYEDVRFRLLNGDWPTS